MSKLLIHSRLLDYLSFQKNKLPSKPLEFIDAITNLNILVHSNWNNLSIKDKNYIVGFVYQYLEQKPMDFYNKALLFIREELDTYKLCISTMDIFVRECLYQIEISNPYYSSQLEKNLLDSIGDKKNGVLSLI